MEQFCKYLFFILALVGTACNKNNRELVEDLDKVIRALPGQSPLEYSNQYLEDLLNWEDYSVIGLGEGTHGTLDFFELKQRLFRFLVEQHNCRTLAYEYSFRKSLLVNDYIQHRQDGLDSLFRGDLWIQDNDALRQFISWMRAFNDGRDEQDQISFIGIDNQIDALMIDEVLAQIESYLPGLGTDPELFPYNVPGKEELKYERMNEQQYGELTEAFLELRMQVQSHILSLKPQEKERGSVALQLVSALQGSHDFLYLTGTEGKNIRDLQLAENVLEIPHARAGSRPVVVWAHNAHVACNPHYTSDGSPAMGWYLRDSLRERYLSVATSFSVGQFTAVMLDSAGNDTPPLTCQIRSDPPLESLNALFHQTRYQQFSLIMEDLNSDSLLYRFFNTERPMIGVGDLYLGSPEMHFTDDRIINLVKAHDLLFYYRDTRPLL